MTECNRCHHRPTCAVARAVVAVVVTFVVVATANVSGHEQESFYLLWTTVETELNKGKLRIQFRLRIGPNPIQQVTCSQTFPNQQPLQLSRAALVITFHKFEWHIHSLHTSLIYTS